MKQIIFVFGLIGLASVAGAKAPRTVTVVGSCQKVDNKIAFVKTETGVAKVPISSSVDRNPACFRDKKFVARVPLKAFLDLN